MKETMKNFSQRALAQLGIVKNSSNSSGHEMSHFTLLPIPPVAEIHERRNERPREVHDQQILIKTHFYSL